MIDLAIKLIARFCNRFIRPALSLYYRYHFILCCRYYGITLYLGKNVQFHTPVRVCGAGGTLIIEDNVSFAFDGGGDWFVPIGMDLRCPDAVLHLKKNCVIMRAVQFVCFHSIIVGESAVIAHESLLLDSDVHNFTPGAWDQPGKHKAIHLRERVKICPQVTILKGVTVGEDTLVGNKSVVQKSLPARCVALGNPARVFLVHPLKSKCKAEPITNE